MGPRIHDIVVPSGFCVILVKIGGRSIHSAPRTCGDVKKPTFFIHDVIKAYCLSA